jgi:alpha-1,2-mannosyltransferase
VTNPIRPANWLTSKRLRAHGTILAVCLWSLYVWTLATPGLRDRNGSLKGTDFLHLYTLGSLAAAHCGADLYDMNAQALLAAQRVPQAAGIRYLPLYPPQVSILFMPLAYLSYGSALAAWWGISALICGFCCYGIWRACPNLRREGGTVVILAIAYPAFFHLIAWGQTSALALGCLTLMFFALRERRELLVGLILGCLIFKPQLGLAAAVVFVSLGAWKTVAGAVVSAAAQLGVGVLYYGIQPLREWFHTLARVRTVMPWLEPRPYQTYSLRTFWSMLVPWPHFAFGLYGLSAIVVLGVTIAVWRHPVPLALRYSALLLATVLVAPHLTVYDLVILAPAFLLLADWMAGQPDSRSPRWLGTILYLIYALPLLGPLSRWTHVQFAVVAMAACVYVLWRTCGRLARLSGPESTESVAK